MTSESIPLTAQRSRSFARRGAILGLASLASYFGAAFLPLPVPIGRLLGFALGPLLAASFLGLHAALATHRDGFAARLGAIFGFVAGAIVTLTLTVQMGNNIWRREARQAADTQADMEAAEIAWRAVNRVQALMDVAWDVFLCTATVLVAIAMLKHPRFGRPFGYTGIVVGTLLLTLNLWTFPTGPADAGMLDAGPLVALWFLAVFVRVLTRGPETSLPSPG